MREQKLCSLREIGIAVGKLLGECEIDSAFVNSTTGNHTHDSCAGLGICRLTNRSNIGKLAQSTRRDNGNGRVLREFLGRLDIHAFHHAVARDVGVHDSFDTIIGKFRH